MTLRIENKPFLIEGPAGSSVREAVPLGISEASSFSRSTAPEKGIWTDILRPFISAPEPYFMPGLLELQGRLSETLEEEGDQLGLEIKRDLKRLQAFNAEKVELLRTHAEEMQSQAKWGAWSAVTEYVACSGSIVLGAACFATGTGVAPALFFAASGFIGLINRIGGDSGAWRWAASFITESHDKQVLIEQSFTNVVAWTSIALAIAGVWSAYNVCAYERLLSETWGRVALGFETATGGMQSALRVREGYHVYNSLKIQKALKLSAEKTFNLQTEIAMDTAEIQKQFALSKELDKVIKSALAAQQQWP